MTKLLVYVAGATRNIERAERFIAKVNAHPLLECVYDWTAAVRREHLQGITDKELTDDKRVMYAAYDESAVFNCHAFVCLAEAPMSAGQSVELGGARMRKLMSPQLPGSLIKLPYLIVSGGNRLSIFTAVDRAVPHKYIPASAPDHEVFDDDEAFRLLVGAYGRLMPVLHENRHTDA